MTVDPFSSLQEAHKSVDPSSLMGFVACWDIPSGICMPARELKEKFRVAKLKRSYIRKVTDKVAFRRALSELKSGNGNLIRRITAGRQEVLYAIVRPVRLPRDIEFSKETIVSYDRISGNLEFTGDEIEELQEVFFRHLDSVVTSDIQSAVSRIVVAHYGIPWRSAGGVYFLLPEKEAILNKLDAVLSTIPGCAIRYVGVVDSDKARSDILDRMRDQMREAASASSFRINAIRKNHKVQPRTVVREVNEFRSLTQKYLRFCDFGLEDDRIQSRMDKLKTRVDRWEAD